MLKLTAKGRRELQERFSDPGHDGMREVKINGTTYTLGWDGQDPQNIGWYLSWRKGGHEDGAQIDGTLEDGPDWQQVMAHIEAHIFE